MHFAIAVALAAAACPCAAEPYVKQAAWAQTMVASRAALAAASLPAQERAQAEEGVWFRVKDDFPIEWDWVAQDGGAGFPRWFGSAEGTSLEEQMIRKAAAELGDLGRSLREESNGLLRDKVPGSDQRWLALYARACEQRRRPRLQTALAKAARIVFIKHRTVRPSGFAYTEGQSDAQNERHFLPGAELCVLELDGLKVRTLVSDAAGALRDPAVSWDGRRVMFAWKKSLTEDDYHLYELDVASNQVSQITSGLGFADYEPAYLPNDDIIFASTRCVQTVNCWWTEVSNLYTCDSKGRFLRRLGFDQAHTLYPQVLDDGRVLYTRWDYNDRGQVFAQPLFQMYADGTGQSGFYGNNSWFPTTIAQARGIPGSQQVLAILGGHHTAQAGKLAVIDPARGRQGNRGVQLVAPVRQTLAQPIDGYGQEGALWQYPYPVSREECLVAYAPLGWDKPPGRRGDAAFGVYWMDLAGRRELLASDPRLACTQPVPLAPRPRAHVWANRVDYTSGFGTFYVQDIYAGPGLAGIARGTVRKLRVVALEYRAAGIGNNGNAGPGGGALVCTPVAIGNGAWDVKTVLGQATVYEDGSALFTVPARAPVYFQALDERGCALQTMRSWTTLQPGEYFACVGCHEHKNSAPPTEGHGFSLAMKAGPQELEPFYGPPRGFSFPKEIQPILDRHCTRCHRDRAPMRALVEGAVSRPLLGPTPSQRVSAPAAQDELAFSLLGEVTVDPSAKRKWSDSYLTLTQSSRDRRAESLGAFLGESRGRVVNWIGAQSSPELLPPCSAGAVRSELLTLLEKGHKQVKLSRQELEMLACWIDLLVPYCGSYIEANAWTETEMKSYEHFAEKRRQMEEIEQDNLRALLGRNAPARSPRPGPMRF
jgi:hypothetical protein